MNAILESGYSASSSLGSFLSAILASQDGTSLMLKIFHRAFRLCSCPTQRATISLQVMLLNWSQAWSYNKSSHSLGFPVLQSLSALHITGCNTLAGAMGPCVMACILMAMSMRMLWHTGMPLLPDGRAMKNDFIPGTVMVWNMKLKILSPFK